VAALRALLDREEAQARREQAKARGPGSRISSQDNREAFLAAMARQETEIAAAVEARLGERLTPREETFNRLLLSFWSDATWMVDNEGSFLGFFPDGQPKNEQHPWHLSLWTVFIEAIGKRAAQAKPDGDETDGITAN